MLNNRRISLLFNISQQSQPHLSALANVSAANILTLLIKLPATVIFFVEDTIEPSVACPGLSA